MLSRTQIDKLGQVLLWALRTARRGRFKKKDIILVRFDPGAIAAAEVIQAEILKLGMHPVLRPAPTSGMERHFYELAGKDQLVFIPPGERELCEAAHGSIYLHAPESLTHLRRVDPAKIARSLVARKTLRDILQRRDEAGLFGWTLCALPTEAQAAQAGMTLAQYTRQIVKACYLDHPDPVGRWQAVFEGAREIKAWLNALEARELHVESVHVDLRLKAGARRRWIGISGHNIPSFEIFLSPDCRGTRGTYYADQPSFRSGNTVSGVRLRFERGRVVEARARKGSRFLQEQLVMDRGAGRVGEFSLTDVRFSRINRFMANTLFDENYGGRYGNCHLALGSAYSDSYDGDPSELTRMRKRQLGFNDSALHWDLVNTEKKCVRARVAGGKWVVIYENGRFQV